MRTAIPTEFRLANRTWKVEWKDIIEEDGHTFGLCDSVRAVITLKTGMDKETTEAVFFHELAHACFGTLGWEKLNNNEGKVDAMGALMHQFLQTKKGRLV